MADVAAARREARRRKILGNSKNRLKLITGEVNSLEEAVSDLDNSLSNNLAEFDRNLQTLTGETSDSVRNANMDNFNQLKLLLETTKCLQNKNNPSFNDSADFSALFASSLLECAMASNVDNESQSSTSSTPRTKEVKPPSKPLVSNYFRKILFIVLATIIRLLFVFQFQYCLRDSVLLPFIIVELTLLLMNKDFQRNRPIVTAILMFSGIPNNHVKFFVNVLNWFEHFLKDFTLYFCAFLIFNIFLEFFSIINN